MKILTAISAYLGIDVNIISQIIDKAPFSYRRYQVPKKHGGNRDIYHPARETKTVQSAAVDLLDNDTLLQSCVKGYVRGLKSPLVNNASEHADKLFLLKLDFKDFFPSIKPEDFKDVCAEKLRLHGNPLDQEDVALLCKLFFVYNSRFGWFLGIGAPSSPFVSNWVMHNLDHEMLALSNEAGCVYTRYADDLCFSANSKDQLLELERKVGILVTSCTHPRLSLNDSKRRLTSKWGKRRVTGLSITPTSEVKVPRQIKRYIRSLLHKHNLGTISSREKSSLAGYLAFLNDCEPRYLSNLTLKYTADSVYKALKNKERSQPGVGANR